MRGRRRCTWCLEPFPVQGHVCTPSSRATIDLPRRARTYLLTERGWSMVSPEARARIAARKVARA